MKKIFFVLLMGLCINIYGQDPVVRSVRFEAQTEAEMNAIPSNKLQQGSVCYRSDTNSLWRYNGTSWSELSGGSGGLSDGDKGDITVSGGATVFDIDAGVVGSTEVANGSLDETDLDTSVNASLDLADSALQSGDNVSSLTNDAGYITSQTDDQTASEVPFTPYSTITSTNTQAAIQELKDEVDAGTGTDDQTASEVNITDSGANYTGTTVEAALGEIADSLAVKANVDPNSPNSPLFFLGTNAELLTAYPSFPTGAPNNLVVFKEDGTLDASDVSYDNTISGLTATNVKTAIDELAASGGGNLSTTDIDTYTELNTIVADQTLTHNGLIDTFSELDAIVADKGLVNLEDNQTISGAKTFSQTTTYKGTVFIDTDSDNTFFELIETPGVSLKFRKWESGVHNPFTMLDRSYDLNYTGDPVNPQDLTDKEYVDSQISGFILPNYFLKENVRVATTANITLSGGQTIDGNVLNNNDRVLVKDQTTQSENGIYTVNTSGAWSRSTDSDSNVEVARSLVYVRTGSVNADKFYQTDVLANMNLDTDNITFSEVDLYGSGGGLANVVEDLTPQLGGDLDGQSTYDLANIVNIGTQVLNVSANANIGGTMTTDIGALTPTDSPPTVGEGYFYADDSENRIKYDDGTGYRALAFQDELSGSLVDPNSPNSPLFFLGTNAELLTAYPSFPTGAPTNLVVFEEDGTLASTDVSYDNTTSGLTATNVKTAIDELAAASTSDIEAIQIACSDLTTDITTGTTKAYFRMPYAATLTEVRVSLLTAGTTTGITVDINESGVSVLSTLLTTDATEKTSETATTPAVISDSSLADDAEMTIDFDGIPTGGQGVIVTLIVTRA